MKILFILFTSTILLFAIKLTKSGDYVIDDTHKIMWQDSMENVKVRVTHKKAIEYCDKLSANGFSDWRLPSKEEYTYIVDKSRIKKEIMIDKSFKYVLQDDYWAADRTWIRNFGRYAYYIFIKSGSIYYQNRTYEKFVRCVRDMK
ncbi:MAG: DUF1566 domain-containing protein [Campylobacterota bacterium]|nr:DUF1566 domain-containing protein [Campylobacterota bacterium]